MAKNEPQSYGSQGEWLTGKTGQTVNSTKGNPATQARIDSEETKGGKVSNVQLAENAEDLAGSNDDDEQPVSRVTSVHGGAKRDSEFKRRDYE